MSIFTKIKRFVQKNAKVVGVTAAVAIAAGAGAATINNAFAANPANSDRDCNDNSVMYCGAESLSELKNKYTNGDSDPYGNASKVYMIHDIYNWFGISPNDVSSMSTSNTTTGYIASNGDVYTGDPNGTHELVATDALTGGRKNFSSQYGTSTYEKYGATGFYVRKPIVSFVGASPTNIINLKAFIVMENGQFKFAIMYSCGNAVKATPVPPKPKPVLTCVELDAALSSTELNTGDQTYNFVGKASVKNGATISSYTFNFGDGASKTVNTSATSASTSHTYAPGSWTATVTVNGSNSLKDSCTRTINVPHVQPPTLTCNALVPTPGAIDSNGDQTYSFEATASTTNGETISNYDFNFGDSSSNNVVTSAKSATTTHKYAPGTWIATVTVHGSNGLSSTNDNCKKTITVKAPQGSLVCSELTMTPGTADSEGNTPYTLEAKATPSATDATISSYIFKFGDNGQSTTVNTTAAAASTTHTYAPGNWTATVTVNGTVNGMQVSKTSANCTKQIKVGQPVTPELVCSSLTLTPVGQANAQGDLEYTLAAAGSATNATITSYNFNFGDNSAVVPVNTAAITASTTHTYAPGSYTAVVSVTGTLNTDKSQKTVTSIDCQAKIVVPAPTCTSPSGQTYPVGSSQCQTCTSPSGQTYPAGSAQCTPSTPTPTPTPTTTLPNTGPGDVIGLFSGVSMSGAGLHRILGNRRARRAARQ